MESMELRSQESSNQVELDSDLPPEKEVITDDWRDAINKVVPAVVVLQTTACRSFDTELPSSGSATGFVVDKNRGIILTNRHAVKSGNLSYHYSIILLVVIVLIVEFVLLFFIFG